MKGEKRFRTALLGFDRDDVIVYIDRLIREFCDELENRDNRINHLNNEINILSDNTAYVKANADLYASASILAAARSAAEKYEHEQQAAADERMAAIHNEIRAEQRKLDILKYNISKMKENTAGCLAQIDTDMKNLLECAIENMSETI